MKRFQSIIQNYINNHQKHKKYLATVLALSMLVSFGVSAGLIKPAVSMTDANDKIEQHIHSDACYQVSCGDESEEHIHSDECYTLVCSESDNNIQLLNSDVNEENPEIQEEPETQEEPEVPIIDSDLSATADIVDEDIDWDSYAIQFDDDIAIMANESGTITDGVMYVAAGQNDGIVILNPKATVLNKTEDNSDWEHPKDVYAVQFNMTYSIEQSFVENYFKSKKCDSFSFNMGFDESWITDKLYNTNGVVYSGTIEAGTFTIDDHGNVVITFYQDFINGAKQGGIRGTFNFKANLSKDRNNEENEGVNIGGKDVEIPVYTYNHAPDIRVAKSVEKSAENGDIEPVKDGNGEIIDYKAKYKIVVSSTNGTNGEVTITDILSNNDDMTFDFADGSNVIVKKQDGTEITGTVSINGSQAVISGLPALKKDESYTWICPVKVKDKELNDVLNKPEKNSISSKNTVRASDGKLTANAEATINQTIKANIAKDGVYESAGDKIKWTVTVNNPGQIDLKGYKVSDELTVTSWSISPNGDGSFDNKGNYTFDDKAKESSYVITYYTDASKEYGNNVKNTANLTNPNNVSIKAEKTVTVPKQQTVSKTDSGFDGSNVEWTITINNPYERDLNGYTVVDEAFKKLTDNPFSAYGKLSGDTLTLNSTKEKTITLKYKVPVSAEERGQTISNTATLKEKDVTIDMATDSYLVPQHNVTLGKYGESSVDNQGNGTVKWVVTINNPYGTDLKDTVISDSKLNADAKLYVGIDSDNNGVGNPLNGSVNGTEFKVNESLTGTVYYLIYETTVDFNLNDDAYSQQFRNEASLGNGNPANGSANELPKKHQHLESKTASFDAEKNEVKWIITITNPYDIPISNWLNKTVEDEMFAKAKSFKLYYDNNGTLTEISGAKNNDKTFTFTDTMHTSDKYVIEYTTDKNPNQHNEENKATFNDEEKKATVNTAPREELTKSYLDGANVNGNEITIQWEVSLKYSQGVFGGQTYKDTMEGLFIRNNQAVEIKNGDTPIELNHYITKAQLDAMEIWGKEPGGKLVKLNDANGKYTATLGTDGKSFTILFGTSDDEKKYWNKYSELNLVYKTTGEGMNYMNDDVVPLGDALTFRNDSEFKNNESSKDYGMTKKAAIQKYDMVGNSDASSTTHMLSEFTGSTATLKWKLIVNESQNYASNENIVLTDLIPEHLTVDTKNFITSVKVNNQTIDKTKITATITEKTENQKTTPVKITIPASVHGGNKVEIEYQVTIPKSELKEICNSASVGTAGSVSFANTVSDEKGNTVTQTQTVVDKLEDFSKSLISPTFEFTTSKNNGNVTSSRTENGESPNPIKVKDKKFTYMLDLNPYKKDLDENKNTITITDTLNNIETYGNQPLDITLLNKKVYQVNDDGSIRELNNNEYKYDYNIQNCDAPVMGDEKDALSSIHTIKLTVPDEMHIRIEYTYLLDKLENSNYVNVNIGNRAMLSFENKTYTVACGNINFEESAASATAVIQPYIQIEKVEEGHYDVKLPRAVFKLEKWNGSKWVPMIGEETITIENEGRNKANWGTEGTEKAMEFATDFNGIYSLPFLGEEGNKTNTIYRLTELSAPTGYYLNPESNVHYFVDGTLASDFDYGKASVNKNSIEKISNQKVTITNAPRSIDVKKSWKNVPDGIAKPPVKVQLYRTNVKLESNKNKSHVIVNVYSSKKYLKDTTDSDYTKELYAFDVDEDTEKVEFKVVSTWLSVNSVYEYIDDTNKIQLNQGGDTPSAKSNLSYEAGGFGNNNVWTINLDNPNGDIVYDVYLTRSDQASSASDDELTFYISKDNNELSGDEREYVLPEGITGEPVNDAKGEPWIVTLNDDNYWEYSFTDDTADHSILPERDNNGNIYHYFVKELSVPAGYTVSYVGNGTKNGSIQVVNTHNPQNLKVSKTWEDTGHENARPATIRVQLYKSTNPEATEFTDADKVGNPKLILPAYNKDADGNPTTELVWEAEWDEDALRSLIIAQKDSENNPIYNEADDKDNNPLTDNDGNPYYFFVREEVPDNYYATYDTTGVKKGTINLTNTYINPVTPPIKLNKRWFDKDGKIERIPDDVESIKVDIYKTAKAPDTSTSGNKSAITGNYYTINTSNGEIEIDIDTAKKAKKILIEPGKYGECFSIDLHVKYSYGVYSKATCNVIKSGNQFTTQQAWELQSLPSYISLGDVVTIDCGKFTEPAAKVILKSKLTDSSGTVKFRVEYEDGSYMGSETYDAATNTFKTESGGGSGSAVNTGGKPYPDGAECVKTVTITRGDNWSKELTDLPAYESDGSEIFYYFEEAQVFDKDGNDVTSKYIKKYDNNNGINGIKEYQPGDANTINNTVTINNTLKRFGNLEVDKKWVGDKDYGDSLTFNIYASPYKITQPDNPEGLGGGSTSTDPGTGTDTPDTPVADSDYVSLNKTTQTISNVSSTITNIDVELKANSSNLSTDWSGAVMAVMSNSNASGINLIYENGIFSKKDDPWDYSSQSFTINVCGQTFHGANSIVFDPKSSNDISVKCTATASDGKKYKLNWNEAKTELVFEEVQATPDPPAETEPAQPAEPDDTTTTVAYSKIDDPVISTVVSSTDADGNIVSETVAAQLLKETITVSKQKQPDGSYKWVSNKPLLPLVDDNGNNLYYYVVEQSASANYIPVAYIGNGIDLEEGKTKPITVHNQTKESNGVEMPSTGGEGVTWYYVAGAGLMFGAVVMLVRRRRRSA